MPVPCNHLEQHWHSVQLQFIFSSACTLPAFYLEQYRHSVQSEFIFYSACTLPAFYLEQHWHSVQPKLGKEGMGIPREFSLPSINKKLILPPPFLRLYDY